MEPGAPATINQSRDAPVASTGPWEGFTRFLGRRDVLPFLLLAPVLIFFIVWNLIPTLWLLGLGFYRFSLTSGRPPRFAGLYNYRSILNDSGVWIDLSRTFLFVFFAVVTETLLGMALGLLFWNSHRLPGRRIALTMLFSPMVLTPVAAGTFWRLIYDPTFGVLNSAIRGLGFSSVDFLGDGRVAFAAVLGVDVWMWTPFMVLMTLAALASVPKAELEAAEIDRLAWHQRLRLMVTAPRQVHPDARNTAAHDRCLQDHGPDLRHDLWRPRLRHSARGDDAVSAGLRGVQHGVVLGACGDPAADIHRFHRDLHLCAALARAAGGKIMRPTSWREHAYHALLWLVALIFFAPIFWIVLSSFKTRRPNSSPYRQN